MPNQGYFTREQLLTVQTLADAIIDLKTMLTGSDFSNVNDWTPGTFQMVLLQVEAFITVAMQQRVASLTIQSIETTASGSALDAQSRSFFQNIRFPGEATIGVFSLTCSKGNGPYTFDSGQLTVLLNGNLGYTNRSMFTIDSTGPVNTSFVAQAPGVGYNLPLGTPATTQGSIAGLTVNTFPALPGTWITTLGADPQSDQSLHVLNETKWGTLATVETPPDRMLNAVVSASNGAISDVFLDTSNPFGPGTVAVYCSFPQAPASQGEVTAITPKIQSLIFNGQQLCSVSSSNPKAFGDWPTSGSNTPIQVWFAKGTDCQILSGNLASTLNSWIASVPTGGNDYAGSLQAGGYTGIADVDGLVALLYQVPGVRKVRIGNQQDIPLASKDKLTAPFVDQFKFTGMWPGVCGNVFVNPGAQSFPSNGGNNVTASLI